jgi:hypothetical protein
MTIKVKKAQPLIEITDSDCRAGNDEANEPRYRDCKLRADLDLAEVLKGLLTEIAEEGWLTEQLLKRQTGFIIGILSLE